jgi:hypothetical protein
VHESTTFIALALFMKSRKLIMMNDDDDENFKIMIIFFISAPT